ncbi:MAG: hypothetical protein ACK4HG_05340 [Agrobacterium albertimagni]|uniref:Uncharacterized protein n=1 Tax=Agrobacterium albertimagni TaxID=147266 RepID=A0A7C1SXR1_9HYPH
MPLIKAILDTMLPIVAAASLILATVLGLVGLVAWADYQNLHCPGANQCSDAASIIWGAGILATLLLALAVGIILFRWKRSKSRAGRSL